MQVWKKVQNQILKFILIQRQDNLNIISQRNIEQIELFDLTGKVTFYRNIVWNSRSFQLDVSKFQKGVYLLKD
jgi:hypothetical protein